MTGPVSYQMGLRDVRCKATPYASFVRQEVCRPCAGLVDTKLYAGRVSSISTLNVGPNQPNPRPNPKRRPNPFCGARVRQAQTRGFAACFGDVFPKKNIRAAERPALTNKMRIQIVCRTVLHMGRVLTHGSIRREYRSPLPCTRVCS